MPLTLGGTAMLAACARGYDSQGYEAVASGLRRTATSGRMEGTALSRELVRYATLAPSSHNTQCWKFAIASQSISILADPARRCPAVDPDEHHVFVSLGCATENLVHAALAHGYRAEAGFDTVHEAIRVKLSPTTAEITPLFKAIPVRQCTRGEYDSRPLSTADLSLLERAGTAKTVQLLLVTEPAAMERVLEFLVAANSAQMADAAFVRELESWIRFNGASAVQAGDGLYSGCTGNPDIPTWVGDLGFRWLYKPKSENAKLLRQVRSSAGLAVFIGGAADKSNWVEVGRCYERFALQATALGIRNAMLNQAVEVQSVRPQFAAALGLSGQRPDLVVRFGRGSAMPYSLRRKVQSVLV